MYKTYVKDMSSPNDLFGLSSRIAYFKNLKDQLEAYQSKTKSVLFRRKNYQKIRRNKIMPMNYIEQEATYLRLIHAYPLEQLNV